jgi:protein TonB
METVGASPPDDDLQFLTKWGEPWDRPRERRAAALSALIHVALVGAVVLAPAAIWETPSVMDRVIVPLIAPLSVFTQKDPNQGKINKEFDVSASEARKRIQIAPGSTPKPFTPPPPPAPKPMVMPEPPKVEEVPGKTDLPQLAQALPQPRIEPIERPKLVLEDPVKVPEIQPGQGRPLPKATADAAIRGLMGAPGGEIGGPGVNLPGSAGLDPSKMQLLSDPMGVDFKPYLAQVLAAVRQYWIRIWPDAARQGRSGRVVIQFAVDRFGTVPKLVIATGSGADALDRAAVAAVAGSVPFPSLPREYKGDQIRLQLNFTYNMPN